jgi:formylglycine-generating enzyme required for sulfatase activity
MDQQPVGHGREQALDGNPYRAVDGRENLSAPVDVLRVVRGGSFTYDARFVRCAVRSGYRVWLDNSGFRVCVSPGL